jgi:hypothetical protein
MPNGHAMSYTDDVLFHIFVNVIAGKEGAI